MSHYCWQLSWNETVLICCRYETPSLPSVDFDKEAFLAQHARIFPNADKDSGEIIWEIYLTQSNLGRGSMIVIAGDAESEAARLSNQGTQINPMKMSTELFRSVSSIDGTILLDENGICHAIGVILDGHANQQCMASRGSRYNSGIRYVGASMHNRYSIVASDDRTVDIIPTPRPLVSKSLIEKNVQEFFDANIENYHEPRNWLENHRFYMNEAQCERINATIIRIESLVKESGDIYVVTNSFSTHDEMNESFLCE